MYNAELVRQLSIEITAEKDSRNLVALPRAVWQENQAEIRVRLAVLGRAFAVFESNHAA